MKKIFLILLVICVLLCGCNSHMVQDESDANGTDKQISSFVIVEKGTYWWIVYDRETLCMYTMSKGSSNFGTFTLLVNADGTPKLWNKE